MLPPRIGGSGIVYVFSTTAAFATAFAHTNTSSNTAAWSAWCVADAILPSGLLFDNQMNQKWHSRKVASEIFSSFSFFFFFFFFRRRRRTPILRCI